VGYTTYKYYKEEYFGINIPETEFARFTAYSGREIDVITQNKLQGVIQEDNSLSLKIQNAVCSVADLLWKLEQRNSKSGTDEQGAGKMIKSKSVGAISISYEVSEDIEIKNIVTEQDKSREIYRRVAKYLSGTGLLYAGL
jgi:hypothetical protein